MTTNSDKAVALIIIAIVIFCASCDFHMRAAPIPEIVIAKNDEIFSGKAGPSGRIYDETWMFSGINHGKIFHARSSIEVKNQYQKEVFYYQVFKKGEVLVLSDTNAFDYLLDKNRGELESPIFLKSFSILVGKSFSGSQYKIYDKKLHEMFYQGEIPKLVSKIEDKLTKYSAAINPNANTIILKFSLISDEGSAINYEIFLSSEGKMKRVRTRKLN